jgi:subtilisin
MPRTNRPGSTRPDDGGTPPLLPPAAMGDGTQPETTGRTIVVFKDESAGDPDAIRSALNDVAGLRSVSVSEDYADSDGAVADDLDGADARLFTGLGIVVVAGEEAGQALTASLSDADSQILAIEPEYVAYLSQAETALLPREYARGYRDAVNHLYMQQYGGPAIAQEEVEAEIQAAFQDTAQFTWGLQATRVSTSRFGGQGVRVAVLDTGLDLRHPDFRNRPVTTAAFVAGVTVDDVNGHGTHCAGTACGPLRPATGVRRYGVAHGAQLFVGKVFNNALRPGAPTASVIAGIEWAMGHRCRVVSLSLGARVNQQVQQYEVPIRRALNAGTLVVAAAGNNANRPTDVGFVEPPANADAAMAVAAVDSQLRIARFSGASSRVTGVGGSVNIAGPGVAVFSSFPVARGTHRPSDGTSMATPHVAGIAALWAQARGESGAALWSRLVQSAAPLPLRSTDVGSGLVQAPQ